MSSFPENKLLELPQSGGAAVVGTTELEVRQMSDKGYDFIRDAGAAFTATLEGSVSGRNWTSITTLAASGQGAVPDHYNLVRVNVSGAGAIGNDTQLIISGKVL